MDENYKIQERIDELLITITASLIIAYSFFWSNNASENRSVVLLSIIALFVLCAGLFALFWNRFRQPIRVRIFERSKKEIIHDHSGKIADFAEKVIVPFTKLEANKIITNELKNAKTKDEALKIIKSDDLFKDSDITSTENYHYIIECCVSKINIDLNSAHNTAFNRPLKESMANTKLSSDKICRRIRYHLFVVGFIFYLTAITINMLSSK